MERLLFNLMIFPFAIIGGYLASYNPFKLKNRIANRFYPGKLTAMRIFWGGIIFISFYIGFCNWIVTEIIVLMGYKLMEIKEIQTIIIFIYSFISILFLAYHFRRRYGKFEILYDVSKPSADELKEEIKKKSETVSNIMDKNILISLCKYYIKKYGINNQSFEIESLIKELKKHE